MSADRWANHTLITELRLRSRTGLTLLKRYAPHAGADGRQLVVTTETADEPGEVRRVYDLKGVVEAVR